MKRILLAIGMLFCVLTANADKKHKADSVFNALKTAKEDTTKVHYLTEAYNYTRESDLVKAEQYLDEALALAKKLDFTRGIIRVYRFKAAFISIQGRSEEALRLLDTGLKLAIKVNNVWSIGTYYHQMGTIYYDLGKYNDAMEHMLLAVKWREKDKNEKGIADTYIWLGILCEKGFKDYNKSLGYYRQAMAIYNKLGIEYELAYCYSNMGNVYYESAKYDSALFYHFKAIAINEKSEEKYSLGIEHNNVANVYTELKDYSKAFLHLNKSLQYRQESGDQQGIANVQHNLGSLYEKQARYSEALQSYQKGLEIAKQIDAKELIAHCYFGLANVNEQLGNLKASIQFHKLYQQQKDSMYNTDVAEQLAQMETKYETEKKDLELSKTNLQLTNTNLALNKKRTQTGVLAFALITVVVFGYLFYNRYKLKQRQKLYAEIIYQQDMRTKAIIEAEERERIRIAKDLHDGIGQQVSAVKMNLSAFEEYVQPGIASSDRYQVLLNMVDDAIKEVRAVSHNMMPNALLRFGLATAVREFIDKISVTGLLKCNLEVVGMDERLDGNTETVLYRVMQECVNNIIKHAQAKTISIQLIRHEKNLTLMIEDDGAGFDTAQVDKFSGIGLKNIISRVQFLNGTVDFDSHLGRGTTVVVEVPLV